MTQLRCGVDECSYNKEHLCSKGEIMVGQKRSDSSDETSCESYKYRDGNDIYNSINHPSKTINIDCEAVKCVYNQQYRCHAPQVDISRVGGQADTEAICSTFKEK